MIKINNLDKFFKDKDKNIDIFKNLNLDIKTWEFVVIIWPSGSWKSTF